MFNLFKKKTDNKKAGGAGAAKNCDDDPDCPMCHVSAETVEQLKKNADAKTKQPS